MMSAEKQTAMAVRPCPLCGSGDSSRVFTESNFSVDKTDSFSYASRKLPEYMHHRLIFCRDCDLLYANPVPKSENLAEAYQEAAFDSSEEAHFASRTYSKLLPMIMKRLPVLSGAIDIGTGDGAFLEELLARGFTGVIGVEPSTAPIAAAKDEIRPLIRHDIFRSLDFQPESMALISCFQTLEHLDDPKEMCRSARKILKDGGAVYFICHNRRSFSAKLLGMKSPIFDIEHLQLFSPKSAMRLLEEGGFTDIQIWGIWNKYPLHYWIKLFPMPVSVKRALIYILKKIGVGHLPIPLPAGNLAVIGFKKGGKG